MLYIQALMLAIFTTVNFMVDAETGSAWVRKGEHKVLTDKNLVFRKDFHQQAQSHWLEASKAQNLDKWVQTAKKAVADDMKK